MLSPNLTWLIIKIYLIRKVRKTVLAPSAGRFKLFKCESAKLCNLKLKEILSASLFDYLFVMQESIVDEKENQKNENIHLRRFLRILANIMILCCLGGSGYLIYFVVKRSQDFAKMDPASLTWFQKNEAGLH